MAMAATAVAAVAAKTMAEGDCCNDGNDSGNGGGKGIGSGDGCN